MHIQSRKIEPTHNSPEIFLDPEGKIKISGRSIAACSSSCITLIEQWVDGYASDPAENTQVDIELEYLNKANLNTYSLLLKKLLVLKLKNRKFTVNWIYEEGDEDIRETGEFFSSSLNIPINFIEKPELSAPAFSHQQMNVSERISA
jgi:hypothetical protein